MSDYLLNVAGGNAAKKLKDQGDGTVAEVMVLGDGSGGVASMVAGTPYPVASSAATTNATSVKTSAGTIDGVKGKNTAAYAVYVRLYDTNTTPTVGGGTSIDILEFPASMSQPGMYDFPAGLKCSTGIGFAIVKSDGSAVAAGDMTNFALYYR